ncbi:hypothetical protein CHLNCDRAFT_54617, partial [Chlorella variabilis]
PEAGSVAAVLGALAGTGNSAISTFELLNSGAVAALRRYLQGADLADTPDRQHLLLQRLGEFAAAAVPPGSGSEPPLGLLVGKLLGALAASEKFAVQLNPITTPPSLGSVYGGVYYRSAGGGGGARGGAAAASGSLTAGLSALSSPLKMRLSRAGDEPGLRDYSANMVLIEPLASMSQIEEFLWPLACGCESLVMGSRGLGLSKKAIMGLLGVGSVSDYVLRNAPCNVVLFKDKPAA